MSWIGGSISSLTGQLSNLTKDILSEGTEEVSDPATELRVAKGKIVEYESLVGAQKAENDRLKFLIRELEEKSESAELQINSISTEYRCLLEEKEKEINELKHKHNEILQHQIKSSLRGPESHHLTPAGSIQSLTSSTAKDSGFDGSGYQSDDLDFGDNIRLQQEINRFSQEVQRLKSECHHWKSIASQVPSADGNSVGIDWASSKEILDLQAKLQTLEHNLEIEKDQHQHEVAALQDLHSQKMAALRRKQKQEVTSLQDQLNNASSGIVEKSDDCDMSALDEQQNQLEAVESKLIETRQQLKVITSENNVLQEESLKFNLRMEFVTNDVERYKKKAEDTQNKWENAEQELMELKQEHSKVRKDVTDSQFTLLDMLDANHAHALELIGDLQHLRHQMNSDAVYRRNKLLQEKQEIVEQIIDLGQKQRELKSSVGDLGGESIEALHETADIVERLGNAEQQQLTADIMDTLQKENLILKQKNLELQEQVTILEKAFQTHSEQRQRMDESAQVSRKNGIHYQDITDPQSLNSGLSEDNPHLDRSISLLQSQVNMYEHEIEQFENVKTDWQTEKETLEEVLLQLRDSLKDKELALSVLQAQKDDLSVKLKKLKESTNSWDWNSDEGVDETSSENNGENECTALFQEELSALREKLYAKETELSTLQQEKIELELSIDELDTQHQEALDQVINIRNNLSKKTEQLAFELSERGEEIGQLKQELIQLKDERVILKENIDTCNEQTQTKVNKMTNFDNEFENKVSELTDNVKRLETALKEKTNIEKIMTVKVNNAGVALNELHMDKKDLEKKLEQSRKQTSEKVEKIKVLREENIKLRKDSDLLSKQLNESEDNIPSSIEVTIKDQQISKENEDTELEQLCISREELEKLKEANALLEIEKSECFATIVNLQKELVRSNESEQSLQNEMESMKLQFDTTETEKFRLDKELQEINTNFQNQTEYHVAKIQELENEIILLQKNFDHSVCHSQSQIQQYDMQIQELCAKKLSVDNDLNNAHDKIREHENRLKEFHAKYEMDKENLRLEIEKLVEASLNKDANIVVTSNLELLQQQLSLRERENKELKENLVDMEQKLLAINEDQIEKKLELKLNGKEDNLLAQLQEMEKHVVLVMEEKDEIEKELHTLLQQSVQRGEEDLANIVHENIDAKQEPPCSEEEKNHLKKEVDQIKNKMNTIDVDRKELESRCAEFYEQLTSVSAENNQMKETLAIQMQNFEHDKQVFDEEDSLQQQITQLKQEKDVTKSYFGEEKKTLLCSIQNLERQLENMKEENEKLGIELKSATSYEERTEEGSVRSLEVDLLKANEQIEELQQEVRKCEALIQDHIAGILELNKRNEEHVIAHQRLEQKFQQQEVMISVLQQNSLLKAEEICDIQRKFERASSMLDEKSQKMLEDGTEEVPLGFSLPAIEYVDNSAMLNSESKKAEAVIEKEIVCTKSAQTEKETMMLSKSAQNLNEEDDYDMKSIAHELEQLQQIIREKDSVIAELQQNNSSLLKMLETTSTSVSGSSNKAILETHRLENELKSMKMEKEQILSVMNEKSRECSNLRNEVHQLMNVISAEKAAISKLQKDNLELMQGKNERPVDDMQREALQNLSRLVRDKDVEVEALTQKNETLLALLQESSSDSTQVSALLQDKENLVKQLAALQSEREQLIVYLNQKHQESLLYHNEIQKLTIYIGSENEKFETMSKDYQSLVPLFEDNKQALVKANNELINYRQKYSELELKYGELLQRSDAAEVVDAASHRNTVQELNVAKTKLLEMQSLISEKEEKVQRFQRQLKELDIILAEKDAERNSMKKQVDSLEFQVQGLKIELNDLGQERQSSRAHTSEQTKEKQHLQEMNNQLMLKLQENEFELKTSREKITTLTSILNEQQGAESQVESLMTENETVRDQMRQFQQERDQAIMALKQLHQDIETDMKENVRIREKEMKLQSELNRLRGHLLQIEEGYTRDALEAEEREKELRNKLIVSEEKLLYSTTAVENASHQVSQQMDSFHQQLHSLATQRDQAYLQIAKLQEQCQQYSMSLANLQMVLEQFQKERENQIVVETERYMKENMTLKQHLTNLQSELVTTNQRLEEAADGLEAAARLSEQLDRKEEALGTLREEVQFRENVLKEAEEKVENLKSISEGKVDKFVMKNLFLGYFATPKNKQHEVIHMVGSVLEFSKEDFDKVQGANRGWVPGFFKFGSAHSTTPSSTPTRQLYGMGIQKANKSFSELFVKFLEKESSPPPPTVRLPAEEMARDVEKQREAHRPAYNPFTAPRHVAMPIQSGQSSLSNSHILMNNESVSSPLPLFLSTDSLTTSTPRSKSGFASPTTSSAILKDVLEPH